MPTARRIEVAIYGRIYRLVGEDPERTREVAMRVDETMRHLSGRLRGADNFQVAVLAALHLADELATVRGEFERYRDRVSSSSERILAAVQAALERGASTLEPLPPTGAGQVDGSPTESAPA